MAIDPNTLLNEGRCLSCNSNASESEIILLALLQRIAEASGGTPGLPLNSVQFNDGGAFGGDADLTWNKTTNTLALIGAANNTQLALTGYSLTGANAQSMVSLAGTWNTTGNPTALNLSIVNTASGATAKFAEFLGGAAGATSQFVVTKFGQVQAGDGAAALTVGTPGFSFVGATGVGLRRVGTTGMMFTSSAADIWFTGVSNIAMRSNGWFAWSSTTDPSAATDIELYRDAADTLAQRRTTNAQTFRLYRTFTNSTNYERLALQTAAGQMILAAETAGTGTDDLDLLLTAAGVGRVTLQGGANLLKTTAAMTSGAAAGLGTLSNAPTAGNPAVWCPIMFNGVQHWFPCWT